MAGVVVQAAAEEVAKLIRPKEKPRPPGSLLGRPGRGLRSERNTLPRDMCFHCGAIVRFSSCDIFAKRCRDNVLILRANRSWATASAPARRLGNDGPGLATKQIG